MNESKLPLGPNSVGVEIIVVDEQNSETDMTVQPIPEWLKKELEKKRRLYRGDATQSSRESTSRPQGR